MGPYDTALISKSFFKGHYSWSREFTVFQDNKYAYTICFILSLAASFLLNYLFHSNNSSKLQASFYVAVILIFGFVMFVFIFTVKKETVLLVVPIAMQLTTTYLSGRQTIISIPWYLIGNLMILDIIVGQQVLCFLAVEVSNKNSEFTHIILFRHTKPRLKYLEGIYKELQEILDFSR